MAETLTLFPPSTPPLLNPQSNVQLAVAEWIPHYRAASCACWSQEPVPSASAPRAPPATDRLHPARSMPPRHSAPCQCALPSELIPPRFSHSRLPFDDQCADTACTHVCDKKRRLLLLLPPPVLSSVREAGARIGQHIPDLHLPNNGLMTSCAILVP